MSRVLTIVTWLGIAAAAGFLLWGIVANVMHTP